jgi:ankyrin repeat protein
MSDGATPAHVATLNGHVAVVRFLGEHGADLTAAMDSGATLASIASRNGDTVMLQLLEEHGVTASAPNMSTTASAEHVGILATITLFNVTKHVFDLVLP